MRKPSAAETRAVWSDDWFEYACEDSFDESIETRADHYLNQNVPGRPIWLTHEWLVNEYEKRL